MKPKMKTCTSCDGEEGYYPSPQYRPFDFRRCSRCDGQGIVKDENKVEEDSNENRFKDILKSNPDLF